MDQKKHSVEFWISIVKKFAEELYQRNVIDVDMETEMIGEGKEYASRDEWIGEKIDGAVNELDGKIVESSSHISEGELEKINDLSDMYYKIPLGRQFVYNPTEENSFTVTRVPGGWIHQCTSNMNIIAFVPFNNEFHEAVNG
jgi:hypothetical protein